MRSVLRNLVFTIVLTILFFFGGVEAYSVIEASLPDTSAESGETIAIPVYVSDLTGEEVYSFQMILTFDSSVLLASSAYSEGTITEGWGIPTSNTFNDSTPAQLRIAMAGTIALSGSGVLVYAVFIVNGPPEDTTTIHFDQIWLNETPPDVITDGLFTVSPGSAVGDEDELSGRPSKLTLFQNYPNPFNPITVIQYALPHECEVDVSVYNILGQKVRTLVKRKEKAGYWQVVWDGRTDEGRELTSGIYFYRIKAGELTETKKMVIIK